MAKLGISEFSFSFSFLHEQVNRNGRPFCVPVLPSLRRESDVGYDAKLPKKGIDYYFQFKMSDYLRGGNAKFIKDGTYRSLYYRIALHKAKKNKQHNLLYMLSQKNPYVYYVAPKLRTDQSFYDACVRRLVTVSSMMIPVDSCGYVSDSLQHFVTYPEFGYEWHFHSKPKRFDNAIEGERIVSHFAESSKNWVAINKEFALNVYERIKQSTYVYQSGDFEGIEDNTRKAIGDDKRLGIVGVETKKPTFNVEEFFDRNIKKSDTFTILQRASAIAMMLYGSALMIVGEN